ncbi:MAG: Na(+)-translocating NADH-quinone reductase subunit C [Gammaproteobacteria bacterium]|nr:Na(+)-translocating NADH-quinone reductase subunit C [Gammaproteobacteria bacterium]MDH4314157.1 Na(+)-translocating NADH-quinone reductase subunit C [Gammaproteobacteria bacterium]MDH5212797.1 Na(+)-translocating NADH-quinone reductase subunit C [Gammaproteobacteria bacterium]MDH5501901.1 Na(+)-translocating NADH-quinone reductase subunit C [Gammaproteobacteria bacterium]
MADPGANRRSRDSVANTLIVAVSLSLVCSVLVAGTAVFLKPIQLQNEADYRQRIILDVAGLYEPGVDPGVAFAGIEARMVELESGEYVDEPSVDTFDAQTFASDAELGIAIPADLDIAAIRRRARYAPVYLVREGNEIEQIILPVYGSGLWSTMYGYLALENDARTVRGLRFYSHAETPGLGDQIDKPSWRSQWAGKKLFDDSGEIRIEVIRGTVATEAPAASADTAFQVDGLAGATLTGRGVTNLVHYWIGEHGFGPYLEQLQNDKGLQP